MARCGKRRGSQERDGFESHVRAGLGDDVFVKADTVEDEKGSRRYEDFVEGMVEVLSDVTARVSSVVMLSFHVVLCVAQHGGVRRAHP